MNLQLLRLLGRLRCDELNQTECHTGVRDAHIPAKLRTASDFSNCRREPISWVRRPPYGPPLSRDGVQHGR
jgi:hypothetical protein